MNISATSWHFRLYTFNKRLLERFRGNRYWLDEESPTRINLCPYMRTILIWGPMVYLFHAFMYLSLFVAFIWVPMQMISTTDIGWLSMVVVFFLGIGLAMAALIYGFILLGSHTSKKFKERREQREAAGIVEEEIGFIRALKAYWKGFHDKTCFALEVK